MAGCCSKWLYSARSFYLKKWTRSNLDQTKLRCVEFFKLKPVAAITQGDAKDFRRWLDKEHPIRWAWDTFRYRRATYEKMFADPSNAHLSLHHVRRSATDLTVSQARPFPSDG